MQYSLASLAVLALTTSAAAQEFITFTRASQSVRDFGVLRRQSDGYQPEDEVCAGEGSTCAEACGGGYLQCSSSDSAVHCYNPEASESCCSTGTGSSCLADYYCTHDTDVETWCCPNGLNLEECATEFGVTGGLTSDIPEPTSTSSAYVIESSTSISTTAISTSSVVIAETTPAPVIESSTFVAPVNSTSYAPVSSSEKPASSSTFITAANATSIVPSSAFHSAAPTAPETTEAPAPSQVEDSAALANGPAGLALVAGIAFLVALF